MDSSIADRHYRANLFIYCVTPLIILVTTSCIAVRSFAGSSFIDIYPRAYSLTQSPPKLSSLSVLCSEKKLFGPQITFVGGSDKKPILVIYTDKPVTDLSRVVTLEPVFIQPPGAPLASPSARVSSDASLDWAYVFDRNGDGRVDYMAFFFAAIPIKPDDFPIDYPKGGKMTSFEHYKLLITQARLVFTHYADDNFDGSTDAVVAAILDPDRYPWVEQFGVLHSTKFNGEVDDTWTFKKNVTDRIGAVSEKDNKFVLQNAPDTTLQSGKELFDFGTRTMKTINDYAEKCGLTKGSFLEK